MKGSAPAANLERTRRGRVHLIQQADVHIVEVGCNPRLFRVDLAELDPALVDPDEDMVSERFTDAVAGTPPERLLDERNIELPGQEGKLADWAESAPDFDSPELAARSLREGRISYRGTIPPQALTLIETPSTTLTAFAVALPPPIRELLPNPPHAGNCQVEVARARAIEP